MSHVLLYSRQSTPSVDQLAEQLLSVGYTVEQTQNLNIPRVMLNPYQIVHFVVDQLPLTVKESVFLTLTKSLGKVALLTIFNFDQKISKKTFDFLCPDGLTVSQTNFLKYFRSWNCPKIILPSLFEVTTTRKTKANLERTGLLMPVLSDIMLATKIKTRQETFFDARALVAQSSSAALRKLWAQLVHAEKIPAHFHLIFSEQKLSDLINDESLTVVLADPLMSHLNFTAWLARIVNRDHLVILNDNQATGFSHAWTSGRNCQVISHVNWIAELNTQLAKPLSAQIKTSFKTAELVEPLINDLSRLYTKILHQKTSLLSSDSVNISK